MLFYVIIPRIPTYITSFYFYPIYPAKKDLNRQEKIMGMFNSKLHQSLKYSPRILLMIGAMGFWYIVNYASICISFFAFYNLYDHYKNNSCQRIQNDIAKTATTPWHKILVPFITSSSDGCQGYCPSCRVFCCPINTDS